MQILLSWSSGKDSAWALHVLAEQPDVEVVGLLTTVGEDTGRVAVHAVREALLARQAEAVGLPLWRVLLPEPCSNARYEQALGAALRRARDAGVGAVAFGDLFLEDIRRYREGLLARSGLEPRFPIWGRDTAALAREMLAAGARAHVVCVDASRLDACWAGRPFDAAFLDALPAGVDPLGENGEFHTFAWDGPAFRQSVRVQVGEVRERNGCVHADLLPADLAG